MPRQVGGECGVGEVDPGPGGARLGQQRGQLVYVGRHGAEYTTTTLGCPAADVLQAYLEGNLSPSQRREVDRHARDCEACRDLLALAQTSSSERGAPPAPRHE